MSSRNQIYFRGDLAEYTGKSQMMFGQMCHEYRILEGHRKGELVWQYRLPHGNGNRLAMN